MDIWEIVKTIVYYIACFVIGFVGSIVMMTCCLFVYDRLFNAQTLFDYMGEIKDWLHI